MPQAPTSPESRQKFHRAQTFLQQGKTTEAVALYREMSFRLPSPLDSGGSWNPGGRSDEGRIRRRRRGSADWIPACAGMTGLGRCANKQALHQRLNSPVIPAEAGIQGGGAMEGKSVAGGEEAQTGFQRAPE